MARHVNFLATQIPNLSRRTFLWQPADSGRHGPKIKAPLLLHYAGEDERINAGCASLLGGFKSLRH